MLALSRETYANSVDNGRLSVPFEHNLSNLVQVKMLVGVALVLEPIPVQDRCVRCHMCWTRSRHQTWSGQLPFETPDVQEPVY